MTVIETAPLGLRPRRRGPAPESVESPTPAAPGERAPAEPSGRPAKCRTAAPGEGNHPRPTGRDRYTISEVAAHTGMTAHTLRWYERIGLMPHVDRSHTGQRRYTNRDLDWLAFVAKLRLTGMPVADMVRYAEYVRLGEDTFEERKRLLHAHREDVRNRIAELRETLAVLDYKIEIYGGQVPAPEGVAAG
ncbi:MerR family transcriptional regulator [Streptomyces sp. URMC 123]|uniref:MerR family transcriptional regulator n=1 Tax=Streptomyces sp. URMC 123 TaxID=3423403 RepID=UPI003F196BAA